jgi:glutathione synthase/RimK-type ligase-like ATP-grasp enzyme
MTVLVVTFSSDRPADRVIEAIEARGGQAFRLDSDLFPTELRLALRSRHGPGRGFIESAAGRLELADVRSVWYRRLDPGGALPRELDPQLRSASIGEVRATIQGLVTSLEVPMVDRIDRILHAGQKALQLEVAARLGLEVPATLTTNDPDAVRAFAAACPAGIITKMLSSFAIHEQGEERVVFTNPVSAEDLAELEGLELCPMTFQERVAKERELRVTIVGRRVFAAAIDSQASETAREDWRRDGVGLIDAWQHYALPDPVAGKLLELMEFFGLGYGAIDLIVTPDGRHVFLEVNPCGEFFWLEEAPGLPISEALAQLLLS